MGGRGGASHNVGGATLSSLRNTAEVEQWLRMQNFFPASSVINLQGVDLKSAKSIADSYQRLFDRYPQLKGEFDGLSAESLGNNTYAQNWLLSGKLEVNTHYYKNSNKLARSFASDVSVNWHPAGTDWESITTHELGHAIDGYLTKKFSSRYGEYYSSIFQQRVFFELRMSITKTSVSREVSKYGATNPMEWFAEAFAEGTRSATPRRMAQKFMEDLDEIMDLARRMR